MFSPTSGERGANHTHRGRPPEWVGMDRRTRCAQVSPRSGGTRSSVVHRCKSYCEKRTVKITLGTPVKGDFTGFDIPNVGRTALPVGNFYDYHITLKFRDLTGMVGKIIFLDVQNSDGQMLNE